MDKEKEALQKAVESVNDEMNRLASKLAGLLDVSCNLGVCAYDPEVDDMQAKMKEVQERKALLERLMGSIDTCRID